MVEDHVADLALVQPHQELLLSLTLSQALNSHLVGAVLQRLSRQFQAVAVSQLAAVSDEERWEPVQVDWVLNQEETGGKVFEGGEIVGYVG